MKIREKIEQVKIEHVLKPSDSSAFKNMNEVIGKFRAKRMKKQLKRVDKLK